jgi:hypothetical protein
MNESTMLLCIIKIQAQISAETLTILLTVFCNFPRPLLEYPEANLKSGHNHSFPLPLRLTIH